MAIEVHPVTPERWKDLEALFGPSGAYSGCWCMWWRVPSKQFSANGNAGNKSALRGVVRKGEPVGLLAYQDGAPVGWMALAPREAYPRVLRSPALKPKSGPQAEVWSVTCFFIDRAHRRSGVASALLKAAAAHAKKAGASIVEGYPVDTAHGKAADLYTGTVELFTRAGYTLHERPPTGRRVIMRRAL